MERGRSTRFDCTLTVLILNTSRFLPRGLLAALCALTIAHPVVVGAELPASGVEFFEKQIRPVLAERCYGCHSAKAEKLKGELLLDSRAGMLRGGKDGLVLIAGKPQESKLIEAIKYGNKDLQMPPKHRLPNEQVAAFEQWIKMGAPDPRDQPLPTTTPPPYDYAKEKQFWSFQPVKDQPIPSTENAEGLVSPIDHFLQAGYESHHLRPVGAADKRVLIRRATYDLTGLPPTPDEVKTFLADDSPSAFERVVDRLLASPHYGEQWGRHWLDVVRYADTAGNNPDIPVPQAYKYRNYVIDAFNNDKPYDQFLREQIAGDLMPAKDTAAKREQIIATGYIAISRRFGSGASETHLIIADTLDNVGKSMLGLSIGCARCHDHKFDPISNSDYYALYGIFASTKYAFPGTETLRHPRDFVPLGTSEEAARLHDYEHRVSELDHHLHELADDRLHLTTRIKAMEGATTRPSEVTVNGRNLKQIDEELSKSRAEQKKLDTQGPPNVDRAYAVSEGEAHDVKIQRKGQPDDLGDKVHRRFLSILGGQELPADEKGSGRLELANWITDPANPLTARVMVNRIWEHHFGKGIVATPNDFGHRGRAPTNPALLDFLASRFVQSGWSVKAMHKLIMLSRAYQMADTQDPNDAVLDPANDLLWHFNPRRLSAEEIRDSILADSGSLEPTVDPGPHPFPPQGEWHYTQHHAFVADYPTDRRSIYLMQQRIRKQPFLAIFDGADTNDTTPDRPISTTAIQALYMMNDPFVHDQADKLAVRVGMALPDARERIDYTYQLLFARRATHDEVEGGQEYLKDLEAKLKEANVPWDQQYRRALSSYLRVLMSSNEFIWLD
jgi:hypothetical protein